MSPRFDLLRACFWLLAVVIAIEAVTTAIAGASCVWLLFGDRYQIGACENVGTLVRNVFSDLLAAVLALLLAGTKSPPPPPGGQDGPTDDKGGTVA